MVLMGDRRAKQGHNAVAQHLVDGALEAVHGLHHVDAGLGRGAAVPLRGRGLDQPVEPLMSANSTVTCLRSPSRAAREVRIFSARYVGV